MADTSILPVAVAAAAVVGWLVLLGVYAARTRNPDITPGPATSELGPESPAVVDLITGGWRLCDEATSATLLDLAARGAFQIEEIGPELSLVRLPNRPPAVQLNRYEQLVYDRVRLLARDGVVATQALAEGQRDAGRWWRGFRHQVVAEARRLGLSRRRWNRAQIAVLALAAAVPALGVGWAGFALSSKDRADNAQGSAVVVAIALLLLLGRMNGERGTPAGAAAAGRWLGVRTHLAGNPRLTDTPAAGVTIWGRHLAYAAALGLAGRAVRSLPVGRPADDRRAWSDYGGMWHAVEVRYGRRFRPWGVTPGQAVTSALVIFFPTAGLAFVAVVLLDALRGWDLSPFRVAGLFGLLVAGTPVAFAIADVTNRSSVTGQIVRLRRFRKKEDTYTYWLAVDTGRSREILAYGISAAEFDRLAEGDVVRARLCRRLGWADQVEVMTPSRYRAGVSYGDEGARSETPATVAEMFAPDPPREPWPGPDAPDVTPPSGRS